LLINNIPGIIYLTFYIKITLKINYLIVRTAKSILIGQSIPKGAKMAEKDDKERLNQLRDRVFNLRRYL
jgi:hypothetical protein